MTDTMTLDEIMTEIRELDARSAELVVRALCDRFTTPVVLAMVAGSLRAQAKGLGTGDGKNETEAAEGIEALVNHPAISFLR